MLALFTIKDELRGIAFFYRMLIIVGSLSISRKYYTNISVIIGQIEITY